MTNRRRRVAMAVLVLFGWPVAVRAHEPLWGETPTIFGPGVFHPEIRFGLTHSGSTAGPGDEKTRAIDQEYGLQYGVNRFVNLRCILSAMRTDLRENLGGRVEEVRVTGIGDAVLSAKYRFHLRQDTGFQASQALILGWKVPLGPDDRKAPHGERLAPSDQPGSGRHGIEVGFAADRERLSDSAWTSVFYRHDIGGGFRKGDMLEVDAAYGRWVVRPNMAEELGINLAVGVHAEASTNDRLAGGQPAGNSHQVAGLHLTPIITKGRNQVRVGIFAPILKRGHEQETSFRYQIRGSWEMFF